MNDTKRIFKTIKLVCHECGNDYEAKSRKSRFCSASCKQVAYNKRNLLYKEQQPDRDKLEKLKQSYNFLSQIKSHLSKENFYLKKDKEKLLKENSELRSKNDELYIKINQLLNMFDEIKIENNK
jgi:RNA binding exosome subunit